MKFYIASVFLVVAVLCATQVYANVEPINADAEYREAAAAREEAFLKKWNDTISVVSLADLLGSQEGLPEGASRRLMQTPGANPFSMLNNIINAITGDWSSIVNAFKTSFSQTLEYEQLSRGWSKFKESTKVFKGSGLTYEKAPEFFANIRTMIDIPANYSKNFDQIVQWIQFFDSEYWSQHDTTFNIKDGGSASHFTMFANNNQNTSKIDVLFLTLAEEFKLAPDVFVISQTHSYLGGIFSSTTLKFEQKPAGLTDEELTFVSQFFLLLAYQEIALAENLPVPPNPNLGPSPPPASP